MSKRERSIGIFVGVALGIFALDRFAITPLLEARDEAAVNTDKELQGLSGDRELIRERRTFEAQFTDNVSKGLTSDQFTAESQLTNSLIAWAEETGIHQEQLNPNPAPQPVPRLGGKPNEKDKAFLKLTCRYVGSGSMLQVRRFIDRIQKAQIPIRITELAISSSKETSDDKKISLGISTIFLAPEPSKANATGTSSATRPAAQSTTRASTATRPTMSTTRAVSSTALPTTRPEAQ